MMIYPSINELTKKTDNKYTLVIATAKRARDIYQSDITFTECDSTNPVTIAINEIHEGKVKFKKKDKIENRLSDEDLINKILEENNIYSPVKLDASDESLSEDGFDSVIIGENDDADNIED